MTPNPPAGSVRAAVVAIGSELLFSPRPETNSIFIASRLSEIGIEVTSKVVVRDELDDVSATLRDALDRHPVVVCTGGLGPTDDDLTRDAVARVLGRPLDEDVATVERIRERFRRRGLPMPELNRRQALVLQGAVLLANVNGTAPGQWIEDAARRLILLPGPPREMQPMLVEQVLPRLASLAGGERTHRRTVGVTGRSESYVEERVKPLYVLWADRAPRIETTTLAAYGQVDLHLSARDRDAARAAAALDAAVGEVREQLGDDVFTESGESLESVVGAMLVARGYRFGTAESCTGGALISRMVDVPGSSAYVERGVVCYSNRAKTELLGVPAALLAQHGAVSEPVALAMATGLLERAPIDLAVAITGIAGPGGGTADKPVGTVVLAVAGPGPASIVKTLLVPGPRSQVRGASCQLALDLVRRVLLGVG